MSCEQIITDRIRMMGKVMFSQVSVCPQGGGYPSPRFLPKSLVSGPFQGGTPQPGLGYPLAGTGAPPPAQLELGYPPWGQNSRASTCYAAGSMPLAFTQDFLA